MKVALIEPPAAHFCKGLKHLFLDINEYPGIETFLYDLGIHKFAPKTFPLNLACIATPLMNNNIEVAIFDANIETNLTQKIKKYSPDVIGISCVTAPSLMWIVKMIRDLKERLEAKIVLGGHHVTLAPLQTLETTPADFVIIGEGDKTFLDLIDFNEGRKKNPPSEGIGYRLGKKVVVEKSAIVENLDELPIPNRSLFKMKKYNEITIQSSRGCVRKCNFCYISAFNCPWRHRKPEKVIEEINYLINQFGIRSKLYFADENFTANLEIMRKMCRKLVGLDVSWRAMIDRFLSFEDILLMKKAGCESLYMGIDSVPRLFKNLPKYRSENDLIRFSNKMKKVGIRFITGCVIMSPWEEKNDLNDLYKLIWKIRPSGLDINIFRPYPNTASYFELLGRGFNPPKSFYGWGKLMRDIFSLNNLNRVNFTKNEKPSDIINFVFKLATHYQSVNLGNI